MFDAHYWGIRQLTQVCADDQSQGSSTACLGIWLMSIPNETPLSGKVGKHSQVCIQWASLMRHYSSESQTACLDKYLTRYLGRSQPTCLGTCLMSLPNETLVSATWVQSIGQTACLANHIHLCFILNSVHKYTDIHDGIDFLALRGSDAQEGVYLIPISWWICLHIYRHLWWHGLLDT